MKTGLVSISFRPHSPEEILRACAESGLEAVEWGSDVHAPETDPAKVERVAEMQKNHGICCCSYGTYFRIGKHRPEEIYPYIRAAEILGTETLRIWCGVKDSCRYGETEREALQKDCAALCRIAEKEDITLCTEFHHGTYTDCAERVLELSDLLMSPCFKTYWQPNQFQSNEENMRSAAAVAHLTENLHIFNWKEQDKYPLAEAEGLWKAYFSHFRQASYALLEFMPDGSIGSLPCEAASLRRILGM